MLQMHKAEEIFAPGFVASHDVLSKADILLTSTTPRLPALWQSEASSGRERQCPCVKHGEIAKCGVYAISNGGLRSKVVEISPSWIVSSALLTDIS